MAAMKRVCVFCGASPGANRKYSASAHELGRELAIRDLTLVYGGGDVGLMGRVAQSVMDHGGDAIGVIPRFFVEQDLALDTVTEIRIVDSMHERKMMMADLSDAFLAMPGGFGTLEEILEVLTWTQLGIHQKACGFLNIAGFYNGLLGFLDHAVAEEFIHPENRAMIQSADEPGILLDALAGFNHPKIDKVTWIKKMGK